MNKLLRLSLVLGMALLGQIGRAAEAEPAAGAKPGPAVADLYRQIEPKDIPENAIKLVGSDWMLITAGTQEKFNSMTASWGGLGVWNKPVAFILVRNTRYTYEFLEKEDYFTLSFYEEKYRPLLKNLFGTKSGRDTDKVKESGFTPLFIDPGIAYQEARMIIVCKKIYADRTRPECRFPATGAVSKPDDKYHKLYFGEIVTVWVKK